MKTFVVCLISDIVVPYPAAVIARETVEEAIEALGLGGYEVKSRGVRFDHAFMISPKLWDMLFPGNPRKDAPDEDPECALFEVQSLP